MSAPLLEVENLTKYFMMNTDMVSRIAGKTQTLKAVDDISFSIEKGSVFGLLGPNGAGKSTTMNQTLVMLSTKAAMSCKFSPNVKATGEQIGEMTFVFVLQ